jgi:hypothetical protein
MSPIPNDSPPSSAQPRGSLRIFFLVLIAIALLRVAVGFISVPLTMFHIAGHDVSLVQLASLVVSVLFVAAPILGLFSAAAYPWTYKKALALLVIGAVAWYGCLYSADRVAHHLIGGSLVALSQTALVCWCFALGALLALILKDRNLILPIAIFLALFDMWLVFAPEGMVQRTVVRGNSRTLQMMAYQAPQLETKSSGGRARAMVFVGPADFVFLSMFFVALYRFKMRTLRTLKVAVPTLAIYLLVVLIFPDVHLGPISLGALPALVPIGLVVLIVNRDQFRLNKDEKLTTVVLAVLGTAFVIWRILQPLPPPQVVTLPSVDETKSPEFLPSRPPGAQGRPRSAPRNDQDNKLYPL